MLLTKGLKYLKHLYLYSEKHFSPDTVTSATEITILVLISTFGVRNVLNTAILGRNGTGECAYSTGAGRKQTLRALAVPKLPPLRPNSCREYGYTGLHIVAVFSFPREGVKRERRWCKKVIKKKITTVADATKTLVCPSTTRLMPQAKVLVECDSKVREKRKGQWLVSAGKPVLRETPCLLGQLERLAIKWTIGRFKYCLLGTEFSLGNDHKVLQWLETMKL